MPIRTPQELLSYELQTIQDAEEQASQALQQISKVAKNDQLQKMVEQRLKQGERILQDVQKGLDKLDGKSRRTQNAAARGLIQESERLLKEVETPEAKQAVMIAGLQKLEHYCIAAWGTVKAMAGQTGEQDLAQAMQRAVEEGYEWDREMTELAEGRINPAALIGAGRPGLERQLLRRGWLRPRNREAETLRRSSLRRPEEPHS
jgi:ferritin-like metal-binding protein YciE